VQTFATEEGDFNFTQWVTYLLNKLNPTKLIFNKRNMLLIACHEKAL